MADTRTMAQLLQAPTEGYEDAILIPEIVANNFELKHGLINLVQNKQFFGHDKEDPHAHIRYFQQDHLHMRQVKLFWTEMPRECLKSLRASQGSPNTAKAVVSKTRKNQASAPSPAPAPSKQIELTAAAIIQPTNECPIMRNMQNNLQNQGQSMQVETAKLNNQMANLTDMLAKFCYLANTASTSEVRDTPVVKPIPEVTKDQVHPSCSQSTAPVQPPVGPEPITTPVLEPIIAPVVTPVPNIKPSVSLPYPSRRDNEKSRNQANEQIDKFYEIFKEMSFEISFTDALVLMPKFASTLRTLLGNKEKLTEVARTSNEPCLARTSMNEHCSAVILNKLPRKLGDPGKFLIPCEFPGMDECLALADLGASINLMPFSVWEKLSLPDLTPTCMTLELADRSISKPMGIAKDISVKVGVFHFPADFVVVDFEPDPRVPLILGRFPDCPAYNPFYYDPEGDILILEAILNSEPPLPPPSQGTYLPEVRTELKVCETNTANSSVDEPTEVELKELPPHLEYAFLEGDNKLPVIIAKELDVEEKSALVKVLKSHKRALAWKLSDIQGINPEFCTHKILMEEDYAPADQMLERLAGNEYYCFLDGFPPLFPNPPIDPRDQEKTTFTCPYGTFAYRRMPFGLCNAPGTFQRCMLAIFHDMVEKTMEVFMDDFSVFGNSFQKLPLPSDHMRSRCEDTNFKLNWEKSHFMVKEGIVLGHKISKKGIEVDKAKIDVIAKLPHPTTVKGIRSFLGDVDPTEEKFFKDVKHIFGTTPSLLKKVADQVTRRCGARNEALEILSAATMDPPGYIMVQTSQPKRTLTSVFF
ncbi:reverse transcriptase domain-containing protein [Tanacetum coccineum]|uniref:Reverse transcriptase domain-containing protein n=1 Tax=Tanacetum coccineum TaxID=301880 RepID=A0ABQ4WWG3_9ASTR